MRHLWTISAASAALALVGLVCAVFYGGNPAQQTAGTAIACAVAIIPYVFARSVEGRGGASRREQERRRKRAFRFASQHEDEERAA